MVSIRISWMKLSLSVRKKLAKVEIQPFLVLQLKLLSESYQLPFANLVISLFRKKSSEFLDDEERFLSRIN